ncbi:MAG: hypothetical protein OK441_00625 [Thaumarchaeota archaeon]|nr:hypothetical protein [Nitrososphaerota archaeon]
MTTINEEPTKREGRRYLQKLWVPVVLAIGFVAGEAISYGTGATETPGRGGPFGTHFYPFPTNTIFQYHVLFTSIEVALLVALVVIYGKMYVETNANFALGLVFVLVALLVQALLSNPVLEDLMGQVPMGPGYSTPAADIFTVCAYTVFLYLSLD